MVVLECKRSIIARKRLGGPPQRPQCISAEGQPIEVIGPQRKCGVIRPDSLLMALKQSKNIAAVDVDLGEVRVERNHASIARKRLVVALKVMQRRSAVQPVLS